MFLIVDWGREKEYMNDLWWECWNISLLSNLEYKLSFEKGIYCTVSRTYEKLFLQVYKN